MHPADSYIILLNYNAWQDTIECMESLLKQEYKGVYHIVVVDNHSTNDSREQLLHWGNSAAPLHGIDYSHLSYEEGQFIHVNVKPHATVSFIWSDHNGGFAYGNNIGIRYSYLNSAKHFIWLLNNDTIAMPNTLQELVNFYIAKNKTQKTGLVGCLQRYYHNPELVQTMYGKFNPWLGLPREHGAGQPVSTVEEMTDMEIDYLSGACLLTHTDVLTEVGLLCEDYFLFYEELDFAQRLQKAGFALAWCPTTSILHKHGVSINGLTKGSATPFADFHHFRSEFIFAKKHYRSKLPVYLFVTGLQLTNRLIKGRLKNISYLLKGVEAGLNHKEGQHRQPSKK
ncbi:hypothetical protein SAMN05421788_104470 [Filimonas lacunae]|uniref:Glycosyltransferase 2-like domain-containing protein n=1 Tax=Filimonas lacunae TaxID=477680 RepID=A0A173MS27_9BACT|nr:glycosyltransferase family 2 protein [Filimonas lacunae]BAV10158.1 glycosyl transferase family 2 [Filimonas lacunae]SIT18736.1 hypothetical protein SAMN05421788_104470 [Filimonas lacunae]